MKKIFLTLIAFSFLFAQAPDRINKKIDNKIIIQENIIV